MSYLRWDESMRIGVDFVDADHKVLVELINHVQDAIGDREEFSTLGSVLRALADYTDYHFAREEKLLELCGYPELDEHRESHAALIGKLQGISRRYEAEPESVRADEVLEFLRSWLKDHILSHDRAYQPWCEGKQAEAREAAGIRMTGQSKPLDWTKLRVLVVDDNANFGDLLATLFQGMGVTDVRIAYNGQQALSMLDERPVDLVMCDWFMEGVDGLQFIHRVRTHPKDQINGMALVMLTGNGEDFIRDQALSAGADAFLEKPVTARDIVLTVVRVIAENQRAIGA
ncbi:bacteriohemerythrin [Telmatospirillum sp. J64-1]|uniref:bacteriohemerythrin n=1 Tax=Telmatospirillum sp. J64-1 TaxID=2502183 RepID=UPI00115E751C|nr:bacteriohemerythrin [Telmatospirillum sp. J64-1]